MIAERAIVEMDKMLRTLAGVAVPVRPTPGGNVPEAPLADADRRHAAALMRVNHVGEVCAQALYQGQSICSGDAALTAELELAAREETEHLAWTSARIAALGGRKSLLNPVWYAGALTLGMAAGCLGRRWNLGFLAETERQVCDHLTSHLARLSSADRRSHAVLEQMRADELAHAATASRLGGAELPAVASVAMKLAAKMMTHTAYYV